MKGTSAWIDISQQTIFNRSISKWKMFTPPVTWQMQIKTRMEFCFLASDMIRFKGTDTDEWEEAGGGTEASGHYWWEQKAAQRLRILGGSYFNMKRGLHTSLLAQETWRRTPNQLVWECSSRKSSNNPKVCLQEKERHTVSHTRTMGYRSPTEDSCTQHRGRVPHHAGERSRHKPYVLHEAIAMVANTRHV